MRGVIELRQSCHNSRGIVMRGVNACHNFAGDFLTSLRATSNSRPGLGRSLFPLRCATRYLILHLPLTPQSEHDPNRRGAARSLYRRSCRAKLLADPLASAEALRSDIHPRRRRFSRAHHPRTGVCPRHACLPTCMSVGRLVARTVAMQ